MKLSLAFVLVCALVASAVAIQINHELPPGYSSTSDLAQVLADEPPAAAEARFAEKSDVITFREDEATSTHVTTTSTTSGSLSDDSAEGDTEFDGQIAQVQEDIKKLKEEIKETQECAKHLTEQEAELRSLQEQREHLQKEKDKYLLQQKLEKQMRDLAEINKISRALRAKFSELKRTQNLIKTKLTGTRSSLNQLENGPEFTVDQINDNAENIGAEVDAMHEAQKAILDQSHTANSKTVKEELKNANRINLEARASSEQQQQI